MDRKYDFAGWVTKNDIICSDGLVIKHNAFSDNDKSKVPLVWEHNHSDPTNVLGHVELTNQPEGVYGYGYFNETPEGQHAKTMVQHGDISAMSIAANKLKKMGSDVIKGKIFEVSLVLAGANPGALIEHVMQHSDNGEDVETDKAIIYTGQLIHSADDVLDHKDNTGGNEMAEKTIGDVLDTLNEEQTEAVEALVANVLEQSNKSETTTTTTIKEPQDGKEGNVVKHNVFSGKGNEDEEVLTHSEANELLADAKKTGSLKETYLEHGITNIEKLFPDAHNVSAEPFMFGPINTAAEKIYAGIRKSPFARVKTVIADLTGEEARAHGYIKGDEKLEQVYDILTRETLPQTVYKKQKLDRDDIVDIVDFDVVRYTQREMRQQLIIDLARAILVSDGRANSAKDKIKEDKIRPIAKDDDLYTIKVNVASPADMVEAIILAMAEYRGSGSPTMFIQPELHAKTKLLKANDGRYLFGDIPTDASMASRFGVKEIVPTEFFGSDAAFIIVNLGDYTVGASKGGEITTFDDFDIDFNQYKYLIETRCSGALTVPKSAIYGKVASTTTTTTVK